MKVPAAFRVAAVSSDAPQLAILRLACATHARNIAERLSNVVCKPYDGPRERDFCR
jgi:hypothetical protein